MKKTFPININGNVFYIDEDAYQLLLDYLSQLRATFTGEEGDEIVNDIESRISEHFQERISLGANVIILEDVNRVIETMGRPEEISGDGDDQPRPADASAPDTEAGTDTPPDPHAKTGSDSCQTPPPIHKRLYRDIRHKVFGGVLAGLGQYMGWDVTVMRILAVILTVCTYFWPCIILYLIAWMVIPVARTPREILEMQGQPVTLDNIGQTVINNATPPAAPIPGEDNSSFTAFINTFFSIAAKFILGFFLVLFSIAALTFIVLILVSIAGIILLSFFEIPGILEGLDFINTSTSMPVMETWGYICIFFAVLLPILVIVRYVAVPLFRIKTPSAAAIITTVIFEVLFIIGAITLLAIAGHSVTDYSTADYTVTYSHLLPVITATIPTITA